MITNVILIVYNSSINKKLILQDLRLRWHISCFCAISTAKIIPNTATALSRHLICLTTACMYYSNWLIKCKNLTQMIMHTFRKKWPNCKNDHKGKNLFKLIGKDSFLSMLWTDHHTEFEEYQRQLSTLVLKISTITHSTKYSLIIVIDKIHAHPLAASRSAHLAELNVKCNIAYTIITLAKEERSLCV